MVDARALEPFDLNGPVLSEPRGFVVRPSAAGGFEAFAAALSRLLTRAMAEGLWWATIDLAEPHPNPGFAHLGPDEGGALYTEVAGDYYLPPAAQLDDGQRMALRELGWSDPVPDLSGGDDIQPRNHTRSWPIEQLPLACRHTLLTLAVVYGFHEDDRLQVRLDPFA
jgi:hypothetical protein